MMKHVSKGVYKREMFYFDGENEKTMDKVNFCNKCQIERMNNRLEASYISATEYPYASVVIPSSRMYLLLSKQERLHFVISQLFIICLYDLIDFIECFFLELKTVSR